MNPGREMDLLVAEKVMNLKIQDKCDRSTLWDAKNQRLVGMLQDEIPHYSSDIAAAWEVVEKLRPHCFRITVFSDSESSPTIQIVSGIKGDPYFSAEVYGPIDGCRTVPHGICLAALRAVGAI